MRILPKESGFGAKIEGLDLSNPLTGEQHAAVVQALGTYGVVNFPQQQLDARQLREFSGSFGTLEINVAGAYQEPGVPEVMILSNIVKDGKPIGLGDAGQDWHTDMSYSRTIAFANVLYGIQIPRRDGRPLGATRFCSMHAAYDALPDGLRRRLEGMTVLHDFNKFWEMMRRERGSNRPPLSDAQRAAKPPVSHPIFMTHPITGRKVLYANPGYAIRINEVPELESEEILGFLFRHQTEERFTYTFEWTEGDVLMWDNIGTIHKVVDDYGPNEHRLIKRCQVMADRFFQNV